MSNPKVVKLSTAERAWKKVRVRKGKLSGGILTDAMMAFATPSNNISFNGQGLSVVRPNVSGQMKPIRPR